MISYPEQRLFDFCIWLHLFFFFFFSLFFFEISLFIVFFFFPSKLFKFLVHLSLNKYPDILSNVLILCSCLSFSFSFSREELLDRDLSLCFFVFLASLISFSADGASTKVSIFFHFLFQTFFFPPKSFFLIFTWYQKILWMVPQLQLSSYPQKNDLIWSYLFSINQSTIF